MYNDFGQSSRPSWRQVRLRDAWLVTTLNSRCNMLHMYKGKGNWIGQGYHNFKKYDWCRFAKNSLLYFGLVDDNFSQLTYINLYPEQLDHS